MQVAQDLLGKVLCVRQKDGKILKGIIVETEAYKGEDDLACHASKGKTKRTEVMYRKAGTVYVYLIYGMYHCLNIVTEGKDYPAAVLIRGVMASPFRKGGREGDFRNREVVVNGPGKVCKYFGIDKGFNGDSVSGKRIWIEDKGIKVNKKNITKSKRIGVDYAKHCKGYPWRFVLLS